MKKQAIHFGAEYIHGSVEEADLSRRPFRLKVGGEWIEARTVIIASGASARWLGIPGEEKFIAKGYSSCATCDGFFFRNKKIMVVGGGDSAMEEANFLTRFGESVALVHRREEFRASKIMIDRARANPKIKMVLNAAVESITGNEQGDVVGVVLKNFVTGEKQAVEVERAVCGDRPYSEYQAVCGPDRYRCVGLHYGQGRRADEYRGCVPYGGCGGPGVPANDYGVGGWV